MGFFSLGKKILPMTLLFKIKYLKLSLQQKKLNTENNSPRIFYLDSPHYGNIGDQAIAFAIKEFAKKNFGDYEFVEIQQCEVAKYITFLKRNLNNNDIIFLTGGGNMGNIYRIFEATRRIIINNFRKNKIIVFPQTIDYEDDFFGKLSKKMSVKIYSSHPNLIICAREKTSYSKMKELYPENKIILCPDIVLYLDTYKFGLKREKIGICLRDDCEKSINSKTVELIKTKISNSGKEKEEFSTVLKTERVNNNTRTKIIENKLKQISSYEFVITDRLHTMIFCAITETPCIVFENSNKKISGVYNWIKMYSFINFITNDEDFSAAFEKLINYQYSELSPTLEFDEIINAIKE